MRHSEILALQQKNNRGDENTRVLFDTQKHNIRLLLRREGERAHYKSEVLHHLIGSKLRAHWV